MVPKSHSLGSLASWILTRNTSCSMEMGHAHCHSFGYGWHSKEHVFYCYRKMPSMPLCNFRVLQKTENALSLGHNPTFSSCTYSLLNPSPRQRLGFILQCNAFSKWASLLYLGFLKYSPDCYLFHRNFPVQILKWRWTWDWVALTETIL